MRAARWVLAVVVGGFLIGSWLAWLPHAENEPCSLFPAAAPDGSTATNGLRLWPPATRCEFQYADGRLASELIGPSAEATVAWIIAATALIAAAVARRSSSLLRGLVSGSALLALIGSLYYLAGELVPAAFMTLMVGPVVVAAIDRRLREPERRDIARSLVVGVLLAPGVLFVWFFAWAGVTEELATPVGIATGGLVSVVAGRLRWPTPAEARPPAGPRARRHPDRAA